ncbi:hypothetical protein, partial [Streptomyces boluensis]
MWRRTRAVLALTLVVLAGAMLVTWATDSGPFSPRSYCWGAWQEGSGPQVLGEDFERVAEESGAPERGEQATCTMETAANRLVARVGPPPRSTGRPRQVWLADVLHGNAAPLPEGLPGVVGRDRGTLVLPKECDSGGVPMVVTVRSHGLVPELESERDVVELLLSLANTAREKAGCAQGEPSRITAPVRTAQQGETYPQGRPSCRVPGMRIEPRHGTLLGYASAVGNRLQTCSLELSDKNGDITARGQFVMTSHPRLTALFAGMAGDTSPGAGWRGKG